MLDVGCQISTFCHFHGTNKNSLREKVGFSIQKIYTSLFFIFVLGTEFVTPV